jgi:hypothetical protein
MEEPIVTNHCTMSAVLHQQMHQVLFMINWASTVGSNSKAAWPIQDGLLANFISV